MKSGDKQGTLFFMGERGVTTGSILDPQIPPRRLGLGGESTECLPEPHAVGTCVWSGAPGVVWRGDLFNVIRGYLIRV